MKRPDDFVLVGKGNYVHIARRRNPGLTLCGTQADTGPLDYWHSEPWCVVCCSREEALISGRSIVRRRDLPA